YTALSYTWGDMNDAKPLRLAHTPLRITANLDSTLRGLRNTLSGSMCDDILVDKLLWVDALCINQGDNAERGHQVAMMQDIYSAAGQVSVWLSDNEAYQKVSL
ncbi:uncharacterized protein K452DRAFT_226331, partial [Aplosporella prunicola CBS 121167]